MKYKLYIIDILTEYDDKYFNKNVALACDLQVAIVAKDEEELAEKIAELDANNYVFQRSVILKIYEIEVKNKKVLRKLKDEILECRK